MERRLVAALACRNNGSRLFGKPMQVLTGTTTVLDQIIASIKAVGVIHEIVLGVSEGSANGIFVDVAHAHGISYIFGDPQDVLKRLIQCGRVGRATDVFRVTTECPWFAYAMLEDLWHRHVTEGNDITVCDRLPEGLHFEIYTLEALEQSHARGGTRDRSELCSNYARTHRDEFKVAVVVPPKTLQRMDLRVTIDYPEDLVLCRAITAACADSMPLVPVARIVDFLDSRPDLKALVQPYVHPQPLWG
jgi:spore coat polysaccharide biosynthesis protein SpsF